MSENTATMPHCGFTWANRGPAGPHLRWTCTLDRGHEGDHEAWGPPSQHWPIPFSTEPQEES